MSRVTVRPAVTVAGDDPPLAYAGLHTLACA